MKTIETKKIYFGLLVQVLIFIVAGHSQAATYYIAPDCTYNGNGRASTCAVSPGGAGAYNTWDLSWACGNTYLAKRGEKWTTDSSDEWGGVYLNNLSCSGNELTIGAYGSGHAPVITTKSSFPSWDSAGTWTNHSGNVWYNDTSSWGEASKDPVRVWLSGTHYAEANDTVSNGNVANIDSIHRWYANTGESRIYIYATQNPASAYTNIEGLQGSDVTFTITNSSYINISGIRFEGGHTAAIEGENADFVDFYNNNIVGKLKMDEVSNQGCDYWNIYNNTFDMEYYPAPIVYDNQNMIDAILVSCGSNNIIRNNTIIEATHDAIYIECSNASSSSGAQKNEIYENYITWEDVTDINFYGRCFGFDGLPHTANGSTQGNIFTRNYCKNPHNRSQPNGYNNVVSYNIFDTMIQNATAVYGSPASGGLSMKAYSPYNESASNKITNNVFYKTADQAIYIADDNVYDHEIKNNIFLYPGHDASRSIYSNLGIWVIEGIGSGGDNDTGGILIENNIYYADGANRFIYNDGYLEVNNASFKDCTDCSNTGNINANPQLSNATRGDFSLLAASPAINAGINPDTLSGRALLPGSSWPSGVIAVDPNMDGTKPEIGAYIYNGNTFDNCPSDPLKTQPGICGCGVSDFDTDSDTIPDCMDNCPATPNSSQSDTDGDGIGNPCDSCPNDSGNDLDGDGICGDLDNCPTVSNPNQVDVDADTIGDACDTNNDIDLDNDTVWDTFDNCPATPNADQADTDSDGFGNVCDICPDDPNNDIDGDSVCGNIDNCPSTPNIDQADIDNDGIGYVCDACPDDPNNDIDGDSVCGNIDNCPTVFNPEQTDSDNDGSGDACDSSTENDKTDSDGDGVADASDNCPTVFNSGQADIDADGFGNVCDTCPNDPFNDADSDGFCADEDNCPGNTNAGQSDIDNDGIGDLCDLCPNDASDDADLDGVCGDLDACPEDPDKTTPGICGCNNKDVDSDGDNTLDCIDGCPYNENKIEPDVDGCNSLENFIYPGNDIEVSACGEVDIKFEEVISGGFVECTAIPNASSNVFKTSPSETNFKVFSNAYNIDFTGEINGIVTVCFSYSESEVKGQEKNLRLFHSHQGAKRQDITTFVDTENNIICGEVTQFSEFGVVELQSEQQTASSSKGLFGIEGCFIATAAFGSYMEPHVMTLRHFRDTYLLESRVGTSFVNAYYRYSPPIAAHIAKHDMLRSAVRIGLTPLVGFSWLALHYGIMPALLVFFMLSAFLFGITRVFLLPKIINKL